MDDRIGAHRVVALVTEDADPLIVVRWDDTPVGMLACLRRLDPRETPHARTVIGLAKQKSGGAPQVPFATLEHGGMTFLASGFTAHVSLRRLLEGCFEKRRRLSPHVAAHIVARAASGLSALGASHGALDLARVGVDPRGEVLVVGLGAAHAQLDDRAMPDTRRIGYSAPEIGSFADADERADVFSLGVILWEALTLRRLFPTSSEVDARARMHATPVPPPTTLAREVPEALEAVVMQALSLDRNARFPTLAAFAGALAAVTKPVQPALLARLVCTLVDPSSTVPGLAELAKSWRGIAPDEALIDSLAAPLPTFFPKSFGDEPMRPKRVTGMPPRTQTLIGVTAPIARPAQAPSAMGRVPVYKPKASTLVGMTAEPPRTAPRAAYAEASVPTNAAPVPVAPNRRVDAPPPGDASARRADATIKTNRPKTVPPPVPADVARWPEASARVPEVVAPEPPSGEWDDEDTTFYSRQEGWDDGPATATDLPPVDQLPTSTLPQRALGGAPKTSPGTVAAPTVAAQTNSPSKAASPTPVPPAKAVPSPAKPGASTARTTVQLGPKPVGGKPASATTSGISTQAKPASATTSGISTQAKPVPQPTPISKAIAPAKPAETKVPVPEAKVTRTALGVVPPKRATLGAIPTAVARSASEGETPSAAPPGKPVGDSAAKPASSPPVQDPSWSTLLEANVAPQPATQPQPDVVQPASVPQAVVPPPAQSVLEAAGVRSTPDAPTMTDVRVSTGPLSEPPVLPTTRHAPRIAIGLMLLAGAVAAAFLIGRHTAPTPQHAPPAPHVAITPTPPPPVATSPVGSAPVAIPAPVAAQPTPVPAAVDASVPAPDAAVAVAPPPEPPPVPEPTPEPPPPTTTARTAPRRPPPRMVAMTPATMTATMRPVIRAPDF